MKRTRASLKDILQEDQNSEGSDVEKTPVEIQEKEAPGAAPVELSKKNQERIIKKSEKRNTITDIGYNISDKVISKSDYVKMSITIEPDLFESVDDLSRKRRRRKEKYTYSDIVRDALKEYFRNHK